MLKRLGFWGALAALIVPTVLAILISTSAFAADCDKKCLEAIGDQYRAAYLKHDPKLAPFAKKVRFTENNVEMEFPDATWDTVTQEIGTPLTLSDPKTGNVGIYTRIMQNDTPGFLVVRLKVERGQITEVEHIISTKRNLSSPPTPIGDVNTFERDPNIGCTSAASRARLARGAAEACERLLRHASAQRSARFVARPSRRKRLASRTA